MAVSRGQIVINHNNNNNDVEDDEAGGNDPQASYAMNEIARAGEPIDAAGDMDDLERHPDAIWVEVRVVDPAVGTQESIGVVRALPKMKLLHLRWRIRRYLSFTAPPRFLFFDVDKASHVGSAKETRRSVRMIMHDGVVVLLRCG